MKKYRFVLVLLPVLITLLIVNFYLSSEIKPVNASEDNIKNLIISSLPSNMELNSREVTDDGVSLYYTNNAEPFEFKDIDIQILKPGAKIAKLKTDGKGWWLSSPTVKNISIENNGGQISIQDDHKNLPWIEITVKFKDKVINALSRGLTEEELINAIKSIKESSQPLKDNKKIINEMDEIRTLLRDVKDIASAQSLLEPFKNMGWVVKENHVSGKLNEIKGVELRSNDQSITLDIGNSQ